VPRPWNKVTKKSPFDMRLTGNDSSSNAEAREDWTPRQYFNQYISNQMYEKMAECTNRRAVEAVRKSLNTSAGEIKMFWGIGMLASCLG